MSEHYRMSPRDSVEDSDSSSRYDWWYSNSGDEIARRAPMEDESEPERSLPVSPRPHSRYGSGTGFPAHPSILTPALGQSRLVSEETGGAMESSPPPDPRRESPLVQQPLVDGLPEGGDRPSEADGAGQPASAALPLAATDPPVRQAGLALGVIPEGPEPADERKGQTSESPPHDAGAEALSSSALAAAEAAVLTPPEEANPPLVPVVAPDGEETSQPSGPSARGRPSGEEPSGSPSRELLAAESPEKSGDCDRAPSSVGAATTPSAISPSTSGPTGPRVASEDEDVEPPPAPYDMAQTLARASEGYRQVQKALRPVMANQARIHAEVTRTKAAWEAETNLWHETLQKPSQLLCHAYGCDAAAAAGKVCTHRGRLIHCSMERRSRSLSTGCLRQRPVQTDSECC